MAMKLHLMHKKSFPRSKIIPTKTHNMEISSNISLQNKSFSPRIIKLYLNGRYQQQRERIVTDFDHNAMLLLWENRTCFTFTKSNQSSDLKFTTM